MYSVLQSAHSIQDTSFLTNNKQSSYIGLPANSGPDFQSSNSKQDAEKAGANSSPSLRNRQKEVKAAPLRNDEKNEKQVLEEELGSVTSRPLKNYDRPTDQLTNGLTEQVSGKLQFQSYFIVA